jgi:hypothetical protein
VPKLIAYHASPDPGSLVPVEPAPRWRDWMNETTNRFANRCLPLLVANEAGWVMRNPEPFRARWDGGSDRSAIEIEFLEGTPQVKPVQSHFGHGVLSWAIPYLFRTPPGYNMLARGPANWPKDGISALEGLVETDWSVATFTMNWRFTRPDHDVVFERGEPFCMVVPQRRGELESFEPEVRDVREDPDAYEGWKQWHASRDDLQVRKFLSGYSAEHEEAADAWEGDYFRGRLPDGEKVAEHQTKLRLSEFTRP